MTMVRLTLRGAWEGALAGGGVGALLGGTAGLVVQGLGSRVPDAAAVPMALAEAGGSIAAPLGGIVLGAGEDVRAVLRVWVVFMAVALVPPTCAVLDEVRPRPAVASP